MEAHWALSFAAVTPGTRSKRLIPILTRRRHVRATKRDAVRGHSWLHEPGGPQFLIRQNLEPWDPAALPDHDKFYLYHVEAGTRIMSSIPARPGRRGQSEK